MQQSFGACKLAGSRPKSTGMNVIVKRGTATMILTNEPGGFISLQDLLCDLEKEVIGKMLEECGGIKARAADRLRLNRTTLVEKARKYGFPIISNRGRDERSSED